MGFITTIEAVIKEGNLGSEITADQISPHIEMAEIELKRLLGDNYDIYANYSDSTNQDELQTFIEIQKAAYNLALSYAVHALNIETQGSGIVRAKGFDASRSELLFRDEIKDLSEHFRNIAMDLLEPYLPQPAANEDDVQDNLNLGTMDLSAI